MCLVPVAHVCLWEQVHSWLLPLNENWRMETGYEIPAGFWIQPPPRVKGDGIYITVPYVRLPKFSFTAPEIMRGMWGFCLIGLMCARWKTVPLRFKNSKIPFILWKDY